MVWYVNNYKYGTNNLMMRQLLECFTLHTYLKQLYLYYSGSQENSDELDKADTAVCTKAQN